VLIGQPELRAMLRRPEMEQVAQRVIARYHLDALSEDETVQYLRHRLAVAGLTSALPFTPRAMQHIHRAARGVPRRINLVADRALLGAYAEGAPRADHRIVDKAATEVFGAERRGQRLDDLRRSAPWGLGLGGLAAGLAVAGLAAWWIGRSPTDPPAVAAAPAASAAAASAPAASASDTRGGATLLAEGNGAPGAAASAPLFLAAAEISARAPWRQEAEAWRELAVHWGIALPEGTTDPCAVAQRAQWHCWRTASAGLALVRQLDRPGFITLTDEQGQPALALLLSMTPRAATLRLGRETVDVTLVSLAERWQGDFATYWRAPEGYGTILLPGMRGPAVDALAAQLANARGEPPPATPAVFDNALRAKLVAFQAAQGLSPDGRAGATTFMQLARAAGSGQREPRLLR
jgi:general secretion pathway protein A